MSNKGLTACIYRQLNNKNTNNLIQKLEQDLSRQFSKENTRMVDKHRRRHSKSLIIREMQLKTTVRYHFTPIRMDNFQKRKEKQTQNISVGKHVGKPEPCAPLMGMKNGTAGMENSVAVLPKLKTGSLHGPASLLLVYACRNCKQGLEEVFVHPQSQQH